MTSATLPISTDRPVRRGFLIGLSGQAAVVTLAALGLVLAAQFDHADAAGLLAPALGLLSLSWLVIDLIVVAFPHLRARVSSGTGLLLGWTAGAAVIVLALAVALALR